MPNASHHQPSTLPLSTSPRAPAAFPCCERSIIRPLQTALEVTFSLTFMRWCVCCRLTFMRWCVCCRLTVCVRRSGHLVHDYRNGENRSRRYAVGRCHSTPCVRTLGSANGNM